MLDYLHHLFIPSERNNYRAKLLHIDFLSFYLVLALFLTFTYKIITPSGVVGKVLGVATDITIDKLYELTNLERTKDGLSALSYNSELATAATSKAKYMFDHNLWAHYGTDGTTPWSFISAAGYRYVYAGENLAKDFLVSNAVVTAWMNSPSHRENIMRPEYEDVGFAIANGVLNGEETTLVVQMFGKKQGSQQQAFVKKALAQENTPKPAAQLKEISPKPIETTKPTAQPQPTTAQTKIAATTYFSKFPVRMSLNFSVFLFGLLLMALAFDFYFAFKLRLVRVVGKHVAHFIFLAFMLISVIILTKGVVL